MVPSAEHSGPPTHHHCWLWDCEIDIVTDTLLDYYVTVRLSCRYEVLLTHIDCRAADNTDCWSLYVAAARPSPASASGSGFGTVGSSRSGAASTGPPKLTGLFSGGMPQLRSRSGPSIQSDGGSSTTPRPGQLVSAY